MDWDGERKPPRLIYKETSEDEGKPFCETKLHVRQLYVKHLKSFMNHIADKLDD